ncbi:MAG: RNA polymerase sigma factor [Bryobacteraceae bacterium]
MHERFAPRVYYLALRELRSRADAEDVRAETILRVLQAIRADRLSSPEALPSFVLGTARNVIREINRKGRGMEAIEDRDFGFTPVVDVDQGARKAIERVIRRLKPREQAFLRLYYYDELPNEQISRQLGIREERLRLIKSRALKSFREFYTRLVK